MDFGQQLFEFLKNPNVAYVLLILGLWMLAIAVTTPGTGFAEVVAAIALVGAAVGLFNLTVNFAGILLIVVAFALFIVDVFSPTHGILTFGGVVALLLGSLLLFPSREVGASISGWLIAGATVISAGMASLVLIALADIRRRRGVGMASQRVVGATGRVRKATVLGETGTAQIAGQLWTIEADEPIEAGAEVVVERVEGLRLHVARAQPEAAAPPTAQGQ